MEKMMKSGSRTTFAALTALIVGANFIVSASLLMDKTPSALAQTQTAATVQLSPGALSIVYTPADFVMSPVNISSPVETYYSYYNNPRTVDPDGMADTRDGTALRVQDGRFKGGFELQAQVDTDYRSENNAIPRQNLGLRTGLGGPSEINETVTPDTVPVSAPLDLNEEYTTFTNPIVLLNGETETCDEGRVGIYTVYPSFRLLIPNDTPAGTYTASVTYTLLEQPTC
jgi:hypothetical protein